MLSTFHYLQDQNLGGKKKSQKGNVLQALVEQREVILKTFVSVKANL